MSRAEPLAESVDLYFRPHWDDTPRDQLFLDVDIPQHVNRHQQIAPVVIDWWSRESIEERRQTLTKDGSLVDYLWRSHNKGLLRTAELMRAVPEDMVPLVWLAAFLVDLEHARPDEWRGPPARFRNDLTNIVRTKLRDFGWWHHAMRNVLPESLAAILRPASEVHEIRDMVHATQQLCTGHHQIVVVRPVERTDSGEE